VVDKAYGNSADKKNRKKVSDERRTITIAPWVEGKKSERNPCNWPLQEKEKQGRKMLE